MTKKILTSHLLWVFILAVSLAVPSAFLFAEDGSTVASSFGLDRGASAGLNERITLDLRNIEITEAIKFLALKGNLNMVIGKNVTGRLSLFLTDVTVADLLEIILLSNNLAIARQGDIYNVMTETEYQALYGKKYADVRVAKIVKLRYAVPSQVFTVLSASKSDIGKVVIDEDSATLILLDTPDKVAEMEKVIHEMEKGQNMRIFNLRFAKAADVELQLKERLDALKLGTVKADERSNTLVVTALSKRMEEVERIVQALDEKTREVLIEAKIIQVTLTDNFDTGINWQKVLRDAGNEIGIEKFRPVLSGTFPIDATLSSSSKVVIGNAATDSFSSTFQYLQRIGQTKILSCPRITAINKEPARILVGTREAFVTTTTTTGQTTSTTAENVTFVDVGISLEVTPTINDDGYVTMKIKPEVSSVGRTLVTPTANQIPIIDTTLAETSVMVKDGTTIVIGGLRKDNKTKAVNKVPVLGSIPIIGAAFRGTNDDASQVELVVFLTPYVIGGDSTFTDKQIQDKQLKPFKTY